MWFLLKWYSGFILVANHIKDFFLRNMSLWTSAELLTLLCYIPLCGLPFWFLHGDQYVINITLQVLTKCITVPQWLPIDWIKESWKAIRCQHKASVQICVLRQPIKYAELISHITKMTLAMKQLCRIAMQVRSFSITLRMGRQMKPVF